MHDDEQQLVVDWRVRGELLERQELRKLQISGVGQEVHVGPARPTETSLLPVAHRVRAYGRMSPGVSVHEREPYPCRAARRKATLDDIERTEERIGRPDPETLSSVEAGLPPSAFVSADGDGTADAADQRDLPDAEEILALVTVGAADGITIQDPQGRLVYANLAAARLSGYDSVEAFLGAE